MMQAIWKFPLALQEGVTIYMPAGAQILCLQTQGGAPCIWALVSVDAPKERREFVTYGTGHKHEAIKGRYVGTYQLDGGSLVFHVFEETTAPRSRAG